MVGRNLRKKIFYIICEGESEEPLYIKMVDKLFSSKEVILKPVNIGRHTSDPMSLLNAVSSTGKAITGKVRLQKGDKIFIFCDGHLFYEGKVKDSQKNVIDINKYRAMCKDKNVEHLITCPKFIDLIKMHYARRGDFNESNYSKSKEDMLKIKSFINSSGGSIKEVIKQSKRSIEQNYESERKPFSEIYRLFDEIFKLDENAKNNLF